MKVTVTLNAFVRATATISRESCPFRIEKFFERYEFTTRYTLSSSDCESQPIGHLLGLEPGAH